MVVERRLIMREEHRFRLLIMLDKVYCRFLVPYIMTVSAETWRREVSRKTLPLHYTYILCTLCKKLNSRSSFLLLFIRIYNKVNVKLSLCLTEHHAMKTYWGVEV
jgi:hypothetical protein